MNSNHTGAGFGPSKYTNQTRIDVRADGIWGSIGMVLSFLAGVAFLVANGFTGSIKRTIVSVGSFFCFQFALKLIQMLAVLGI